jgi:hypothetical protein
MVLALTILLIIAMIWWLLTLLQGNRIYGGAWAQFASVLLLALLTVFAHNVMAIR